MVSDPIADMLTRIRNAGKALHNDVSIPSSKLKVAIADVLKRQGYISNYEVKENEGPGQELSLELKYLNDNSSVIAGLKRESRPSCRVYAGAKELPRVMGGLGIVIVSTPLGVKTGKEAKNLNVGGEVLCRVW